MCTFDDLPLEIVEMMGYYLPSTQKYLDLLLMKKGWWYNIGETNALERYNSLRSLFFRGGISGAFDDLNKEKKTDLIQKIEDLNRICDSCNGIFRGRILTEEYLGKKIWKGHEEVKITLLEKLSNVPNFAFLADLTFFIPCIHFYKFAKNLLNETIINPVRPRHCNIDRSEVTYYTFSIYGLYCILIVECGTSISRNCLDVWTMTFPYFYIEYNKSRWNVHKHRKRAWLDDLEWVEQEYKNEYIGAYTQCYFICKCYMLTCMIDRLYTLNPKIEWFDPYIKTGKLLFDMLKQNNADVEPQNLILNIQTNSENASVTYITRDRNIAYTHEFSSKMLFKKFQLLLHQIILDDIKRG